MATATATVLSMKLLIDRKAQRVLFAEASKEVVDFLFSFLALPMATTAKLMIGQDSEAGSISNLYASVEKLDSAYFLSGAAKEALLQPTISSAAVQTNRALLRLPAAAPPPPPPAQQKILYRCRYIYSNCYFYVAGVRSCAKQMTTPVYYTDQTNFVQSAATASSGGPKGFVQGLVSYTVTDDLAVTPMSTISGITLLDTFAVRDLGDLQQKTVQISCDQVIYHFN